MVLHNRTRKFEIIILLLFLLTPVRAITLFILPLVLLYLYRRFPYRLKYRYGWYALVGLFLISSLLGLAFDTTSFEGVTLSCIIFLPMIFFLFCEPNCYKEKKELLNSFAKPFIYILLVIDVIGLFFWHPGIDDGYGMAYGSHYETVHGLAMVNIYVFLWFTIKSFYGHLSKIEWAIWGYITFSVIACSYGLGFICLIIAIVLFLIGKASLKSLLLLLLFVYGIYEISQSSYFWYERGNIQKISENVDVRKITMYNDFYKLLKEDARIFYVGTGPGGYNSRSTLLLSGDNQNFINKELGNIEPYYYKKYIYPLWNRTFVSQVAFTDGTRNKPFSSFVSIWAEHGVFFFGLFFIMYFCLIKDLRRYKQYKVHYYFLLIMDIFMIVSLISHLWLETTEFLVYCLIRFFILMSLRSEKVENKSAKCQ